MQRWLSVTAGEIAYGPAAARLVTVSGAKQDVEEVIGCAHGILKIIDEELAGREWMTQRHPTNRGRRALQLYRTCA
jgi:glutathione S-transferase